MKKVDPGKHKRRSIPLPGFDYSQAGAYYVTICTHERECLFGKIVDDKMRLNNYGEIVQAEWLHTPQIRQEIESDEWVIMPNHFHGIVHIVETNPIAPTTGKPGPAPKSLSSLIAGFKPSVTKHINQMRSTPGAPVWQRNYYEHVIRDDQDLNRIREYININPLRWTEDEYFQ